MEDTGSAAPVMNHCAACGAPNPRQQTQCYRCGKPLAPPPPTHVTTPSGFQMRVAPGDASPQQTPAGVPPPMSAADVTRAQNPGPTTLKIVGTVLLVLVGVGLRVYRSVQRQEARRAAEEPAAQQQYDEPEAPPPAAIAPPPAIVAPPPTRTVGRYLPPPPPPNFAQPPRHSAAPPLPQAPALRPDPGIAPLPDPDAPAPSGADVGPTLRGEPTIGERQVDGRTVYEVTGLLENRSGRPYGAVRVDFRLLNAAGQEVATASQTTRGLDPGCGWAFRAASPPLGEHFGPVVQAVPRVTAQ